MKITGVAKLAQLPLLLSFFCGCSTARVIVSDFDSAVYVEEQRRNDRQTVELRRDGDGD
jgi:hypothetical protein